MKRFFCKMLHISPRDFSPAYAAFSCFLYLFLLVLTIVWLYPVLNVFANSFSEAKAVLTGEVGIFPIGFDAASYQRIWQNEPMRNGLFNSIFYAVVGCVCGVFFVALTAYPLSKKRLVFRGGFTVYLAITMYFSGGLIPTFLLVSKLSLYNTRTWIIASCLFAPWYIILMRTFFQNLPVEMEESALLDTGNDLVILFSIYLPLAKPVIATIALYTVVDFWNQYMTPLIYLSDSFKMPIQVALRDLMFKGGGNGMFVGQVSQEFGGLDFQMYVEKMKYTAIVVTMIPMMLLFLSLQKYFVKGVMVGSIKG